MGNFDNKKQQLLLQGLINENLKDKFYRVFYGIRRLTIYKKFHKIKIWA